MPKINISNNFLISRIAALVGLSLLICLCLMVPLMAQTVNQGFTADQPLQKGMLVVVKNDDQAKVEPVTSENLDRLKGVVVQQNDSPVTLASVGQNVFVSTSGLYEVLVSDENGEIKSGDYISISSLAGIGMKARSDQAVVLGRASGDFTGKGDSIGTSENPKTKQRINFGRIQVAISINRNPDYDKDRGNAVPKFMQKIAITIAGKPINTARIWLSVAVFIGTLFVVGTMLYSGARSSLISVGRNPLSKTAIIRGLLQVVILSVIVFITGLFGVYLLLKL